MAGRVTRSRTGVLKDKNKNVAMNSAADVQAKLTGAVTKAAHPGKRGGRKQIAVSPAADNVNEADGQDKLHSDKGNDQYVDDQIASELENLEIAASNDDNVAVPSKKRGATTKAGSPSKRKKATAASAKPPKVKKVKVPKQIVKRNWSLPHGMGMTLAVGKTGTSGTNQAVPSSPSAHIVESAAHDSETITQDEDNDIRMVDRLSVPLPTTPDSSAATPKAERDGTEQGKVMMGDVTPVQAGDGVPMTYVKSTSPSGGTGVQMAARPGTPVPRRTTRAASKTAKPNYVDFPATDANPEEAPQRKTRGTRKRVKIDDIATKPEGQEENAIAGADILGGDDGKSLADFKKKTKRGEANTYGLTRGYSPYPHRTVPTPEQCEEVHRILVETHGEVKQPEKVPAPSIEFTGCGEVPSVLDALLRTRISANTLMANSNKAIQQLAQTYGLAEDGVGKGSINWNKVRLESEEKLIKALRPAGTPKLKAGHIKAILDMVFNEQKSRALAYLGLTGETVPGFENETEGQKILEIKKASEDCLDLELMREMSADEAINAFVKYPGIGVKTAACVLLFCLHIPCFAVDTHVQKMCKWLGWVPEKATELDTFNHGEHMVPDHLKYALHQLFIAHGQDCFKCRKNTKPGSAGWDEAPECPLEHLLDRNKAAAERKKLIETENSKVDAEDDEYLEKKPKRGKGKGKAPSAEVLNQADEKSDTKPKRGKENKSGAAKKAEEAPEIQEDALLDDELNHTDSKTPKQGGKGTKSPKKAQTSKAKKSTDNQDEPGADNDGNKAINSKPQKKGRAGKGAKAGGKAGGGKKITVADTKETDSSKTGDLDAVQNTTIESDSTAIDTAGFGTKAKSNATPVVQQTRFNLRSRRGAGKTPS